MVWPLLPVLPAHIPELLSLPMHHRDPFDRLLIAHARAEGMALATSGRSNPKISRVLAMVKVDGWPS
jgi:PIN domain nuclease of toxin-antitoxin system